MKNRIIVLFILLPVIKLAGQDIHMSQYDASPVILNPALTGAGKNMKYRIVNQYRNQWDAIARKSYVSTAFSYDSPFKEKWGLGGYLLNDNSSRVFNSFNFVISGSHDITIGEQEKHKLCVGLQTGIIHKKIRSRDYTFDRQYINGGFDTDIPAGESFEKEFKILPEINIGFSYINTDENQKYSPYGGIALFHILNPKDNFTSIGHESRLPIRYLFNSGCKLKIKENFILDPNILIMRQRNVNEFNFGLRSYNEIKGADLTLISGVNYRLKDAVILHAGVFYKNFIYRISYDFNVSPLWHFSNYRGGLEFSLTFFRYISRGPSNLFGG